MPNPPKRPAAPTPKASRGATVPPAAAAAPGTTPGAATTSASETTPATLPPAARRQGAAEARAARIAAARVERERKARVAKVRNLGIAIGIAIVLAIAAVIVVPHLRSSGGAKAVATPAGLTTYKGVTGSLYGQASAPVTLTLFEDFQCPYCEQLETTNGAEINSLVSQGKVRILYSMVSFLDANSDGNRYSTRAANAFYCAPQSERKALHTVFYANQPKEDTHGKTDAQVLAEAKTAGIDTPAFSSCFTGGTYDGYAARATTFAEATYPGSNGEFGTPTMLVNGAMFAGVLSLTPTSLDQVVAQAAAQS